MARRRSHDVVCAESPRRERATRPIPVERFLLRAVGRTDVGAQRTQNEDAMYYDDFLGVYVVCDGMGGHASGQVASDIAIRTIVHSLKTGDPPPAPGPGSAGRRDEGRERRRVPALADGSGVSRHGHDRGRPAVRGEPRPRLPLRRLARVPAAPRPAASRSRAITRCATSTRIARTWSARSARRPRT